MKSFIAVVVLFVACFLPACTGGSLTMPSIGTPSAPILDSTAAQRAVYDAEGKYKLALIAANAYVNLPLCTASKPPCATLAVVRAIQKAQPAARAALDAAETTVRTPGFGNDIYSSAVTAASAGVSALTAITNTLK